MPSNLVTNQGQGQGRRVVALTTRPATLLYGDYRLAEDPLGVVVERKGSLREITTNLFDPVRRGRFTLELSRLRDHCRYPHLLFEGTPHCLLTSRPQPGSPSPEEVLDALLCCLLEYRVTPLFLPSSTLEQRRSVGTYVAHLLVRGATHDRSRLPQRTDPLQN